jgi:tetratricopeptide (TPR) repeat protein
LLYPKFSQAYDDIGVVFLREARRDDAKWAFRQALNIDDRSPRALLNLADVLTEDRQYVDAERLLNRLLAIEPLNPEALLLLSQLEFALGRFDYVVGIARRLHANCPKHDGYIHFVSARALEHEGRKVGAIGEYLVFLRESPQDAHANIAEDQLEALRTDVGTNKVGVANQVSAKKRICSAREGRRGLRIGLALALNDGPPYCI